MKKNEYDYILLPIPGVRCAHVRENGMRCRRVGYGVREPWKCGQHDPKTMWYKLTFTK